MRCVAIRQVAFEDLGIWEPELMANGYRVEYLDAGIDPLDDAVAADLVVVLGGPIGVGDVADYPVIAAEIEVVRQRLEADAPTVGVCLGAQIMAAAAGARVHPGAWELGWAPVTLTPDGESSVLSGLADVDVLHWHGDTFDVPSGATLLASTRDTPHQAFQMGRSLALQFHVEVDGAEIERWLIGHTGDLRAHGVDVTALRDESFLKADSAAGAGVALIRSYLRSL